MNANEEAISAIVDEALAEATGRSGKKWALVILALVAGAVVALWLARRARAVETAIESAELESVPEVDGVPAAAETN